jgi:hypothetical protein
MDIVRQHIMEHAGIGAAEKAAIIRALGAGQMHGYGNVMAWLATEWACMLRDEHGMPEETAIEAVSTRSPYTLPQAEDA